MALALEAALALSVEPGEPGEHERRRQGLFKRAGVDRPQEQRGRQGLSLPAESVDSAGLGVDRDNGQIGCGAVREAVSAPEVFMEIHGFTLLWFIRPHLASLVEAPLCAPHTSRTDRA